MNEVLKAIRDRRSIRSYEPEQITDEQLQALLDAALQSPTARNTQQWHFSVVQNRALLDEFSAEDARLIGQGDNPDFHLFHGAPTVIFISRPENCDNRFVEVDCGIAVENIALAAQGLGLGSVILGMPMAVFCSDRGAHYAKLLGFPEGYCFSIAIAVGRPAATKEAHPIGEGKINFVR